LYRGITNSFELATLRTVVSGNFFYDRIPKEEIKEYFYWIQFVSVNATTGEPIGPASAVPMSSIQETIQDLTGLIDAGVLAESLKTEIARIGTIDNSLAQEVLNRIGANNVLADAMVELQTETGQAMTFILDEVNQRTTADDAMITSVNALIAGINGDYAAVVAQQSVLVDADEALAASVVTAQSVLNGSIASVQTTLQTNINAVDGEVTNLGALYTATVDVNGLIGGFGVYNDGTTVEAGFDVDRFWIGRTTNKAKPFIIDNGVVYINEAAIQKLTFSKLRDEAGAFVVANGKVKAAYIEADQLIVGANQVSGLGALAALGSVTVGSNIEFGDGTTLSQGDFVNRLSKIGSGNISTFLDGAAITNAYLGNASVDTLKVAGNAITAPAYTSGGVSDITLTYNHGDATGTYPVFIFWSLVQSYDSIIYLSVDGVIKGSETPTGGTLATQGVMLSLGPGNHPIRLWSSDTRNTNRSSIYAIATKR
jgi:hypothetical protein